MDNMIIQTVIAGAGVLATLASAFAGVAASWAVVRYQIRRLDETQRSHEQQLKALAEIQSNLSSDIRVRGESQRAFLSHLDRLDGRMEKLSEEVAEIKVTIAAGGKP